MINVEKFIKLINVSEGKKAEQSSYSKWSCENDAERALDLNLNADYAFHTDMEKNPWWMVDLGESYLIELIKVKNRKKGFQAKARTMKVEISINCKDWKLIHAGLLYWQDSISFKLDSRVEARYVKISLEEKQYLHLAQVEVLVRETPGLIVAARGDGLGGRLKAILNGMYLAEKISYGFGYVWPTSLNAHAQDFMQKKEIDNTSIIGHAISSEEEIFSAQFIKKYSKTNLIPSSQGVLRDKKTHNIKELDKRDKFERVWGWYAPLDDLDILFKEMDFPDYVDQINKLWYQIGFNEKIKKLIDLSYIESRKLDSFIALHIRSGDIVFGDYRKYGKHFMKKAFPLPLAEEIIKKCIDDKKQVVLFGDETESLNYLKKKYDVQLVEDYQHEDSSLNNIEQALFEITFMSGASKIIASGASHFSNLAKLIGDDVGFSSVYDIFNPQEQYDILIKDIHESFHPYHPLQLAFSCMHAYVLSLDLNIHYDRKFLIETAIKSDPDNCKYIIYFIDICVESNELSKANNIVTRVFEKESNITDSEFIRILTSYGGGRYFYSRSFSSYITQNKDMPAYMLFVASLICEKLNRTQEALGFNDKARQLDPENLTFRNSIEYFLKN